MLACGQIWEANSVTVQILPHRTIYLLILVDVHEAKTCCGGSCPLLQLSSGLPVQCSVHWYCRDYLHEAKKGNIYSNYRYMARKYCVVSHRGIDLHPSLQTCDMNKLVRCLAAVNANPIAEGPNESVIRKQVDDAWHLTYRCLLQYLGCLFVKVSLPHSLTLNLVETVWCSSGCLPSVWKTKSPPFSHGNCGLL